MNINKTSIYIIILMKHAPIVEIKHEHHCIDKMMMSIVLIKHEHYFDGMNNIDAFIEYDTRADKPTNIRDESIYTAA